MMVLLVAALALTAFAGTTEAQKESVVPVFQWSQLEFDYPSESARQEAIENGEFIEGQGLPIDVDVDYSGDGNGRVFITIPRMRKGIPATLGTVSNRVFNGNPIISPFPSWKWHQTPPDCSQDHIISVFRVKIDECDRLWVLDTGRLAGELLCLPQILAFDLRTGNVLHRYEIPEDQLNPGSGLVTPIVDVRGAPPSCRDTFVYSADPAGSLIVHDVDRKSSWKITHDSMRSDPNFEHYVIAGEEFNLQDGVLGMDLSPERPGEDRILFYHALSSGTENWVYTSFIRNQSLFPEASNSPLPIFNTYPGQRSSQSVAEAIDRNGIAYFGLTALTSINCWNTATEYNQENIDLVAFNEETLQFASGIKVITSRHGDQELWFITNRFQKFMTGTLNRKEPNFRIQAGRIEDLTKGSKCVR